jgi:recombinational DNA repair protein (RecF pathway)
MKGFILHIQPVRDEDCIVTVLSSHRIGTYYRFYGARHSVIALGFLIDFETEGEDGRFMPRLRGVSHISFDWLGNNAKWLLWHQWIQALARHLKEIEEIDSFYYNLLLKSAQRMTKQNTKRVVVESYLELLTFEGRIYHQEHCYLCQTPLDTHVSLMQSFKLVHPHCIHAPSLDKKSMMRAFETGSTIHLDDSDVDYLMGVIQRGL